MHREAKDGWGLTPSLLIFDLSAKYIYPFLKENEFVANDVWTVENYAG